MVAPAFVPESPSVADSVAPTVPVPVPVPGGSSEPRGARSEVKMTVTVGEERRARLRTAYTLTHLQEGHRTFSGFIAAALDAEVQRLEQRYNEGRRFENAERGVTRGRPLGS